MSTKTHYIIPEDHAIHVSPTGVLYALKDDKFYPVNGIIADEHEQNFYQYEIEGVRKFYTALGSAPESADANAEPANEGYHKNTQALETELNDPAEYEEYEGTLSNAEVTSCMVASLTVFGALIYGTWVFAKWLLQ